MDPTTTHTGVANGSIARVMIVDDERDSAISLGMLLKLRGYAVEVVTDSTLCLSHLALFKPDIVLMDVAMPRMSGYDLAKEIRARTDFSAVPIIAISGFGDKQHTAKSIESGCNRHLVKPVDLSVIEKIISHEIQITHTQLV
jgi:DNA-binding response OmpR family regulator